MNNVELELLFSIAKYNFSKIVNIPPSSLDEFFPGKIANRQHVLVIRRVILEIRSILRTQPIIDGNTSDEYYHLLNMYNLLRIEQ